MNTETNTKILIINDDPTYQTTLQNQLKTLNTKIILTATIPNAIKLIPQTDLIILDLNPNTTIKTLTTIKTITKTTKKEIPIIVAIKTKNKQTTKLIFENGATGYYEKNPNNTQNILYLTQSFINNHQHQTHQYQQLLKTITNTQTAALKLNEQLDNITNLLGPT